MPLVFREADVSSTILQPFLAYPMHPEAWVRPAGSPDYRITNPFGGVDLVNPGQSHQGIDVGNYRSGDPIRAPATCQARGVTHTDGAIGVIFDLGGGWTLELWHLSKRIGTTSIRVGVGTLVGETGASGNVAGAHTHIELKLNGKAVDPARFLPMPEREAIAIPNATAGSYYFADVPPSHPFFADIEWMGRTLGGGPRGGRFNPEAPVTKGQLAAFLHRLNDRVIGDG